jgi:hypothetical protein
LQVNWQKMNFKGMADEDLSIAFASRVDFVTGCSAAIQKPVADRPVVGLGWIEM